MSWEANTWATKQRMKLPQEQLVIYVLGNCADPDGVAFAKWPGRDHWWHYLAKLTRLSKSSLFRHINTIVALGLGSRDVVVLADGARRPTIRLNLEAFFDIEAEPERYDIAVNARAHGQSHGETDADDAPDHAESDNDSNGVEGENAAAQNQSHHETSPTHGNEARPAIPTHGNDPVPPVGMHIESILDSKDSPPSPPPGGVHDGFEKFVKVWGEPIARYQIAEAEWGRLPTDKHGECLAAAAGLWAWAAKNPKKATPSAQSFIRDRSGWMQWLRYTPDAGSIAPQLAQGYARDSIEGIALVKMHDAFGVGEGFRGIYARHGTVAYRKAMTPQIAAFATMPSRENWVQVNHQQAGAWSALGRELSMIPRPKQFQSGDTAPWPWPPGKDGKLYTTSTGPPQADGLMTEEDEHYI